MGEFFKGWRRKAGLVTLAMACVLTVMWMRSRRVFDVVEFTNGSQQHQIASASAKLYWGAWEESDISAHGRNQWYSIDLAFFKHPEEIAYLQLDAYANFDWTIPYWSLVLPLTLLSAWLILGKPRKVKPTADLRLPARDESIQ